MEVQILLRLNFYWARLRRLSSRNSVVATSRSVKDVLNKIHFLEHQLNMAADQQRKTGSGLRNPELSEILLISAYLNIALLNGIWWKGQALSSCRKMKIWTRAAALALSIEKLCQLFRLRISIL